MNRANIKIFSTPLYVRLFLLSISFLLFSGCGNFFDQKTTELHQRAILREISEIEPAEPSFPKPDIYKTEPAIIEQTVGGGPEFKLFYFCKYHTAVELEQLVNKQFATKLFNEKGKSTTVEDYTVSSMPATNQLVVRCPTGEDAQAVLQTLEMIDIPPIQVRIDCLISEVYADVTMDWETTLLIENLFGERISLGGKRVDGTIYPAFPGAALRDAARATFGLKTGYIRNEGILGHEFKVLVDILISRGYLKILMNPTLEVVNGQTAEIMTSEHVPLEQVEIYDPVSQRYTISTQYIDVIDSLKIIPHVFADGYIGLETTALIGSKSTPEGVKQIPIVTRRQVTNKENRIREGESLVIGGITKTEKRSVVRGVPFLKDIPVLGVLFSSKDFEERGKEVLFILTPTISSGGKSNIDIVNELRRKHTTVSEAYESNDVISGGHGYETYSRQQDVNDAFKWLREYKNEKKK
jgi:type II secretory pathway component GspD/PulD (secretin)